MASPLRPMPIDFTANAASLTLNGARRRWKTASATVERWYGESGLKPLVLAKADMPANFVEIAKGKSIRSTAILTGHTEYQVTLWYRKLGLTPRRGLPDGTEKKERVRPPKPNVPSWRASGTIVSTPIPQRDDSVAGEAAEHLKKEGWIGVYNIYKVLGGNDKNLWQVGTQKMSTQAMIAKAQDKGFVRKEMM